ncbi:MAG: L,D-transpeptidase [Beijerinckiaceae bacterium]|nr:L,D-transpeptidase [Beijerinckiaceae bacterium]MCI0736956.1 L,D-transpeptidase [Beijerinckiaceae bacterium]
MVRLVARIGIAVALLNGGPAFAFTNPLGGLRFANLNPLERGPLADFLNIFREQAIPRRVVPWQRGQAPGTVVISTSERRLYYVLRGGAAIQYGVGVGREGFTWSGTKPVTMKREWPDWSPPPDMRKRRPDLPRHMPGGINNPLGARALYLGSSVYRIHGSNEPETIGAAVSSGCIRMTNRDVVDLFDRVKVGTKVVVLR